MSCTELYKFNKSGTAQQFAETKNAWRGAMAIWGELEKRHLPPFMPSWAFDKTKEYSRCADMMGGGLKEIWALQNSPKLNEDEKIALMSTFDHIIVLKKNIPRVILAFNNFGGETSLPEQATHLQALLETDKTFIAVAWNQTSVNGDVWQPYNMKKQKNHFELFAELEDNEPAQSSADERSVATEAK